MAEPSNADIAKMIESLTGTIASLQSDVATLKKDKEKSSSSSGPGGSADGQHHNNRPRILTARSGSGTTAPW